MSATKFVSSAEAKKAGFFSRRHETDGPHRDAQDQWRYDHIPTERIEFRRAERASRTPQEQIAILDRRLGVGQGAIRERAKLAALISK